MNERGDLPKGLKYTIEFEIDDMPDFKGQPESLLLTFRIAGDSKVIGEYPDPFPDNRGSRDKLQYRLNYISRRLEADLEGLVVKLYNEATLATEFAQGTVTKKKAVEILKRWRDLMPKEAKGRLPLPPAVRGRPTSLDQEKRDNMPVTYREERAIFESAKNVIEACQENPQSGDWREILASSLGDERLRFAEKFASRDPHHPDPLDALRQVTLAYMASHFGVSKRTLERVIPKTTT
jgi:hypothetical protein